MRKLSSPCRENRGKEKICPVMNRKSKKNNFGIAVKTCNALPFEKNSLILVIATTK